MTSENLIYVGQTYIIVAYLENMKNQGLNSLIQLLNAIELS